MINTCYNFSLYYQHIAVLNIIDRKLVMKRKDVSSLDENYIFKTKKYRIHNPVQKMKVNKSAELYIYIYRISC